MKTTETVTLSVDIELEFDGQSGRDEMITMLKLDAGVNRASWGMPGLNCIAKSIDGTATVTTKTP